MTNANPIHDIYLTGSGITCTSNKLGATTHWFRVINEAYAQLLQQQQQLQQLGLGDTEKRYRFLSIDTFKMSTSIRVPIRTKKYRHQSIDFFNRI